MELSDRFWKKYELDLQEVKVRYLMWATDHIRAPSRQYLERFLWDEQDKFCVVNSRYGRSFGASPFGSGVQGIPKSEIKGDPPRGAAMAAGLKNRLTFNTGFIRETVRQSLFRGNLSMVRNSVLDFYWLKLGPHELLFDEIQYGEDDTGRIVKGRWDLDESEGWRTLTGIRNRIVNVVRYGESLENVYVRSLDKRLPGFSKGSYSTFLKSAMTWNRYAIPLCQYR